MDIKDLDRLAKENAPMPSGLAMHEQCYYISSRGLYQQYAAKAISLSQAKLEKKQVIEQYQKGQQQWELFIGLFELQSKLTQLKEEEFNSVLEFEILEHINQLL